MTITFTVANPCSTNAAYQRTGRVGAAFGGRRGLHFTKVGAAFKAALEGAALVERSMSDWPDDPWRVAKARVSYQLVNYRGDTDGVRKLIKDGFERVLYPNDRVVDDGPAPLPIKDAHGKRIIITVELLEWRSPEEAQRLRLEAERRAEKRFIAKYRAGKLPRSLFTHNAAARAAKD